MIKKISFIALIAIIVFFLLVSFSSFTTEPREVVMINYTFMVKENVGFNLDTDKLHFGGGPTNSFLERSMNISSTFDSRVHIQSAGPGSILLDINDFELNASSSKEILFTLEIPSDLELGLYEGVVFFYFYDI
jgi:hypothetical protein